MSRLEEIIAVVKSQTEAVRKLSHNDLNWLIEQAEKAEELEKENERNLKKDIGKSSLDILNGNSDALYNVKHTIDILDAFNNVILGLFKLSDEQWVFNTINVNTDTIDQYKNIEKEIGMELNELAGKIEIMRNLIFAEIIDWHMMSDLFKALEES